MKNLFRMSVFLFLGFMLLSGKAFADVSNSVVFQGRLTDNTGVPISGNNKSFEFKFYDAQTDGTLQFSIPVSGVDISNGLYSAVVNFSGITQAQLDMPLFVEVFYEGTPMNNRTPLGSSPYAMNVRNNSITNDKMDPTNTFNIEVATASFATYATEAVNAQFAHSVSSTFTVSSASYAVLAGSASWANYAGTATWATAAGTSTWATWSATATWANYAGTATWAVNAATSSYAVNSSTSIWASTATWVINSGTATYSTNAGTSTWANYAGTATWAVNAGTSLYAVNSSTSIWASTATWVINAGTATYSNNAGTATWATNAGYAVNSSTSVWASTATWVINSGTSTYSNNAGTATWATNAGTAYALPTTEVAPGTATWAVNAVTAYALPVGEVVPGTTTWAINAEIAYSLPTTEVAPGTATWATNASFAQAALNDVFDIGNVSIGTENRGVDSISIGSLGNGASLVVYGTVYSTSTSLEYADLAEIYPSTEMLEPGDVVIISVSRDGYIEKSKTANDAKVVGVISTDPAIVLNSSEKGYKLALVGKVPVKVTNEGGDIKRGDLLVASSTPGYAMKATDPKPGTIIGKALENSTGSRGNILALVNMQ